MNRQARQVKLKPVSFTDCQAIDAMSHVEPQPMKKRRGFRPQFSVATLLWLMLFCAFFCGYTAWWYGLLRKQAQRAHEAQVQAEHALMKAEAERMRALEAQVMADRARLLGDQRSAEAIAFLRKHAARNHERLLAEQQAKADEGAGGEEAAAEQEADRE